VTIAGIGGTCNYTVVDGVTLSISGCSGTPADGALVKAPDTLVVDDTSGFNTTGSFTVDGIAGLCTYSGKNSTEFHGVSCAGMVENNALVGGGLYYTKTVGPHQYQLYAAPNLTIPVSISGGSGENHRLVPTDQAGVSRDASNRFDPHSGDVNYGTD